MGVAFDREKVTNVFGGNEGMIGGNPIKRASTCKWREDEMKEWGDS